MTQRIINRVLSLVCLCCCFQNIMYAQEETGRRAYTLFDNTGKEITYGELIRHLSGYDIVFLGEIHNCPITHWLEFEITRSLYHLHKNKLMLGAEMLESDNQLILDEYMQRKISYDRFEAEARLWDNYSTDYYPVVFFAKEHGIPFIATNIPRRYANSVKNGGLEVLDSLSAEAKKYIAPLPVPFEYNEKESEAAFSLMNMMGGKKTGDNEKLAQAQAVKDATMGWFIARNMKDKFLHINGSYHSDFKSGIIPYLLRYRPGTSVVTVTSVRQESISKLDDENKEHADFYICVPEDMVTSY